MRGALHDLVEYSDWGPKDQTNIRISHSGAKAQHKWDTRNTVLWDRSVYVVFWGPIITSSDDAQFFLYLSGMLFIEPNTTRGHTHPTSSKEQVRLHSGVIQSFFGPHIGWGVHGDSIELYALIVPAIAPSPASKL